MKRGFQVMALVSGLFVGGQAIAADFLLGPETNGVKLASGDNELTLRIRLQPRIDYGDIVKSGDNRSYTQDKDIYLRRVRLELGGSLFDKKVLYNLTLSGDKWEKAGNTNTVKVHYAYIEWAPNDMARVIFGKEKLPYSRVSLTSSTARLLIENPVSTEDAKKLFGSGDPYYQPKIGIRGRFMNGLFAYEAAAADGWQNNDTVQTGRTVLKSNPVAIGRVELSPPGWVEAKKSDAPLGAGRHLTFGLNAAWQGGIEYKENSFQESRRLWGADLSGHYGPFVAQAEYNSLDVSSDDPGISDTRPRGWYVQAGYFIDGLNIEPAFRYEVYDQDSNSSNKKEYDTTTGLNWYLKGHTVKLGANWVHTRYEDNATGRLANDNKKDVFQLQAQLYY